MSVHMTRAVFVCLGMFMIYLGMAEVKEGGDFSGEICTWVEERLREYGLKMGGT